MSAWLTESACEANHARAEQAPDEPLWRHTVLPPSQQVAAFAAARLRETCLGCPGVRYLRLRRLTPPPRRVDTAELGAARCRT